MPIKPSYRPLSHRPANSAALLAAAMLAAVVAAPAQAGEYTVVQCDPSSSGYLDARFDRANGGDYAFGKHCDDAAESRSLQIRSISAAPPGRAGSISWLAPAGTRLVAASLEARLRRDGGHRARVALLDGAGRPAEVIARGLDAPSGFERHAESPPAPRAGLVASLGCEGAVTCPRSTQARTWIRAVRLTLDDVADPALTLAGTLLEGHWQRGPGTLTAAAGDAGAGLHGVIATLNGVSLPPLSRTASCALAGSTALATRLTPCPPALSLGATIDTRGRPFRDGANALEVCAADYGAPANRSCESRRIEVDNTPPRVAFTARDPRDPELIVASLRDAHSGPASAEISYRPLSGEEWTRLPTGVGGDRAWARVDSSAPPPGRYLFRIGATDRAGNAVATSRRADGGELILRFPLREATTIGSRLRHDRIAYGRPARLEGTLRDEAGRGIAGEQLLVREAFAPGSEPRERSRTLATGRGGRFAVRLPPGPSRWITVSYSGSRRYLGSVASPRRLAVAGMAEMRLERRRVRAGRRVRFHGRIGAMGTAAAPPGKVVELQVRADGRRRWRTVRQALHAGPSGRVRSSYSFDRFYASPARFQFRLKVTREAGWPYRAPAHSRPRTITVVPR